MVTRYRIDDRTRARVFYLHVIEGLSKRTVSRLCHISRSSVPRIANENRRPVMRPAARRGRPRKLTDCQRRLVLRCLTVLREQEGTFSVRCSMLALARRIFPFELSPGSLTKRVTFISRQEKRDYQLEKIWLPVWSLPTMYKMSTPRTFGQIMLPFIWTAQGLRTKETLLTRQELPRREYGGRRVRVFAVVAPQREERKGQGGRSLNW